MLRYPAASLEVVNGAGHDVAWVRTAEVLPHIRTYLDARKGGQSMKRTASITLGILLSALVAGDAAGTVERGPVRCRPEPRVRRRSGSTRR